MRRIIFACLLTSGSSAQWLHYPTPGIPRTPDGKPNLTAPTPRTRDGKPDLSGTWSATSDRYYNNIAADLKPEDVLPWADALYRKRVREFSKDNMDTMCLPLGPAALTGPFRQFRIVQAPTFIAILVSDLSHRQIYLDGRQLEEDPNPTWMGYSVGHWDGDTLVVESNGYTARGWLDGDGHPHTEDLRITERFRRPDFGHMEVQMTLNDPKAYARPWTVTIREELVVDTEMLESVCNENEKDRQHMSGKGPELRDAPVPESTLAKYVGTYDFEDRGRPHTVEITASGGALFWDQDGSGKQRLFPFSDTEFSFGGAVVQFAAGDGPAAYLLLQMAEGETKAVRRN